MDDVQLMNRVDSKYLANFISLPLLLEGAWNHGYRILEIEGDRTFNYLTTYYDTPDFKFYYDHHNARSNRIKVRTRAYLNTEQSFIEIKIKNNKGKTAKKRKEIISAGLALDEKAYKYINKVSAGEYNDLEPKLSSEFSRFTLVNIENKERVTFDFGITFSYNEEKVPMNSLLIIEIKQESASARDNFTEMLRRERIPITNFSKYCIGVVLLHKDVKYNNFKSKVIKINRICDGFLTLKHNQ
jgi:hypothetical protein